MEDAHLEAFLVQVDNIENIFTIVTVFTNQIQNILLFTKIYKISTSVYILQIEQNIFLLCKYLMRYTHLYLAQKLSL